MNLFNQLPDEIQYFIWKIVFNDTLRIFNHKEQNNIEAQELVKYMFWSQTISKPISKESIISFGHPLFVIHLKPLFHTKFKNKALLREFTEFRYKHYFPSCVL